MKSYPLSLGLGEDCIASRFLCEMSHFLGEALNAYYAYIAGNGPAAAMVWGALDFDGAVAAGGANEFPDRPAGRRPGFAWAAPALSGASGSGCL